MNLSQEQANQFSGGIFMIGMALLFLTGYWWPGIMFVVGASSLAQGMVSGRGWYGMQGAFWVIGIGLVFAFGFSLPLLFLLIGGSMVFGAIFKPPFLSKDGDSDDSSTYSGYGRSLRDEDDDLDYIDSNVDVYQDEDDYEKNKRKRG